MVGGRHGSWSLVVMVGRRGQWSWSSSIIVIIIVIEYTGMTWLELMEQLLNPPTSNGQLRLASPASRHSCKRERFLGKNSGIPRSVVARESARDVTGQTSSVLKHVLESWKQHFASIARISQIDPTRNGLEKHC